MPASRRGEWEQLLAIEDLRGEFWEREYWDTFMRDEAQERKAIRYVEANPVKAKLCGVSNDWPFSSARFRDEYRRQALPDAGRAQNSRSANG